MPLALPLKLYAIILRGGRVPSNSNKALVTVARKALEKCEDITADAVQLVEIPLMR